MTMLGEEANSQDCTDVHPPPATRRATGPGFSLPLIVEDVLAVDAAEVQRGADETREEKPPPHKSPDKFKNPTAEREQPNPHDHLFTRSTMHT